MSPNAIGGQGLSHFDIQLPHKGKYHGTASYIKGEHVAKNLTHWIIYEFDSLDSLPQQQSSCSWPRMKSRGTQIMQFTDLEKLYCSFHVQTQSLVRFSYLLLSLSQALVSVIRLMVKDDGRIW